MADGFDAQARLVQFKQIYEDVCRNKTEAGIDPSAQCAMTLYKQVYDLATSKDAEPIRQQLADYYHNVQQRYPAVRMHPHVFAFLIRHYLGSGQHQAGAVAPAVSQVAVNVSQKLSTDCDEKAEDADEPKLVCDICTVYRKSAGITSCGHVYCHHCLQGVLESGNSCCPKCRVPFKAGNVLRVYL